MIRTTNQQAKRSEAKRSLFDEGIDMSQCYSTWTIPKIVHDAFTGNMSDTNTGTVHFDSDSKYIVLDNSANCHICKDKSMFVTEIKPLAATSNLQVQTAGGNYAPQGIGSVRWKWRDDDGKLHNELIEEGLYFPESPVNILGITKWAKQRQDTEGIYITTKANYSIFVWNFEKSMCTFNHSESGLPELHINEGSSKCEAFYSAFVSLFPSSAASGACFVSSELVKPKKSFVESCKTNGKQFQVGDNVQSISNDVPENVKVLELVYDKNMFLSYKIERSDGRVELLQPSTLRLHGTTDIGVVPKTREQIQMELDQNNANLDIFLCPNVLTVTEEEYIHWHHRLMHLPHKYMVRLVEQGFLPKSFSKMDRVPKCPGCAFGKAHKTSWRSKGNPGGSIRKESETSPGDAVSIDQIVSAQEGLVPQVVGTLMSARMALRYLLIMHHNIYTCT